MTELWELGARERIRDSFARYTWSGDALRVDEVALAFCEDGVLEVRGSDPIQGRTAIADFIGGVGTRSRETSEAQGPAPIVRHNVTNLRFLELEPARALVASYFTVFTGIGLDHHGRYRDAFVPVGDEWLIAHRFVSTDWRADGSTMASGRG